jgi:hypothetical protein
MNTKIFVLLFLQLGVVTCLSYNVDITNNSLYPIHLELYTFNPLCPGLNLTIEPGQIKTYSYAKEKSRLCAKQCFVGARLSVSLPDYPIVDEFWKAPPFDPKKRYWQIIYDSFIAPVPTSSWFDIKGYISGTLVGCGDLKGALIHGHRAGNAQYIFVAEHK